MKKTNLMPSFKKITEYVDINEAKKLEKTYLDEYKKEHKFLNNRKTGGLGLMLIWTKDKCQDEALKYKTKNEFKKNARSAYGSAKKNKWFDEICLHMLPVYECWTREKCEKEIMKYKTKKELYKSNINLLYAINNNNWFDLLEHLSSSKKPNGYWKDKENCRKEALKYNNRNEFREKCGGAINSATKYGWLDEICKHMKK
jgi:hypothetical protein